MNGRVRIPDAAVHYSYGLHVDRHTTRGLHPHSGVVFHRVSLSFTTRKFEVNVNKRMIFVASRMIFVVMVIICI